MHTALGQLGWSPSVFWQATVPEITSALGLAHKGKALLRPDLDHLMRRFPDEERTALHGAEKEMSSHV